MPFCSAVTLKLSVNLVLFVIDPLKLDCDREFGLLNLPRFNDEGFLGVVGVVVVVFVEVTLPALLFSCSNSDPRLVVTDELLDLSECAWFGDFTGSVDGGGGGGGGCFDVVVNVLVIAVCLDAGGGWRVEGGG